VLGRGEGYAIRHNVRETQLASAVGELYQIKTRRAPK